MLHSGRSKVGTARGEESCRPQKIVTSTKSGTPGNPGRATPSTQNHQFLPSPDPSSRRLIPSVVAACLIQARPHGLHDEMWMCSLRRRRARMHPPVGSVSPVGWKLGTPMSSVPNESLYRGTDRRGTARLASLGRLPLQLFALRTTLETHIYRLCLLGLHSLCACLTLAQLRGLTSLPFILQLALLFWSVSCPAHQSRQTKKVNDDLQHTQLCRYTMSLKSLQLQYHNTKRYRDR